MLKVCPHCRIEYAPDVITCPIDGASLDYTAGQPDPLEGQVLADRYHISRLLGEGGMGRVYLAEHVRMKRRCAVKVMSPSLAPTPDAISRFNREAANASSINHPNVAVIYDFGETADGTLYLAMEYIEGETLGALIRRMRLLPAPMVGLLTQQIASGLGAAHALGIVHRDLKPDNILVTRDAEGRGPFVKIVDFGIAKATRGEGQTVTTIGMSIGTPEFMSPEQLAGEPLDARSDIYSLALVVFTMLTGEPPYPELASKQSLVQRLTERPRALADVRPTWQWPPNVQAVLDRALSPEPADRYERVGDFSDALVAATGTHGVSAPDDGSSAPPRPVAIAIAPIAPATPTLRLNTPRTRAPSPRSRTPWVVAAVALVAASTAAAVVMRNRAPVAASTTARESRAPATAQDTLAPAATVRVDTAVRTAHAPPIAPRTLASLTHALRGASRDTVPPVSPVPPPAATVRAIDTSASVPAPPSSQPPVVTTQRAGRHAYLNATGDSMARPLADSTPAGTEARELFGHINRARKLAAAGMVGKAGPELRTAFEEFFVFQADHPFAPQTMALRNQLLRVGREAFTACSSTADTSSLRARRASMCDGLEKAMAAVAEPRVRKRPG